jgi:hypothetical protein
MRLAWVVFYAGLVAAWIVFWTSPRALFVTTMASLMLSLVALAAGVVQRKGVLGTLHSLKPDERQRELRLRANMLALGIGFIGIVVAIGVAAMRSPENGLVISQFGLAKASWLMFVASSTLPFAAATWVTPAPPPDED